MQSCQPENIELGNLRSLRDVVTDLLLVTGLLLDLGEDDDDAGQFDSIVNNALECLTDTDIRIKDLEQERMENLSTRSSLSSKSERNRDHLKRPQRARNHYPNKLSFSPKLQLLARKSN